MDDQDVMTLLSSEVRAAGSQAAWAREHGIAPAYLSQVLARRRPPGPSVLAALGLGRRIVIEPTTSQDRACDPETLNTPCGQWHVWQGIGGTWYGCPVSASPPVSAVSASSWGELVNAIMRPTCSPS